MNNDPYMLDPKEQKAFQEETKGKGSGIFCNKKNLTIGTSCGACTTVSVLFNSGKKEDKEVAFLKMAKANFYMGAVTRNAPDSFFILEVGKKAGNAILDGVSQKGWIDISHPLASKGREMMISKSKGNAGFAEYTPSPVLEKADWSIPESVLKDLPNLETDIIDIIKNSRYPIKKISELTKESETFTFRICPPWSNQKDGKRRFMGVVWRHYGGVSQDEVDGKVSMDLSTTGQAEKGSDSSELPWDNSSASSSATEHHDKCYGMPQFFDIKDSTCQKCKDFSPCGKAAMKK